ncbi:MAG: glycosyltransferase family 4 protein [Inquilinus sp.]|nr:glycosyltransferase family 4 protein [Inquilinus sp.]
MTTLAKPSGRMARARAPGTEPKSASGAERRSPGRLPTAVVLTGTDPATIKGGIATAVAGYHHALIQCDLFGGLIPTFQAGSASGKWLPWVRALPALRRTIDRLNREGKAAVVYGHAGPRFSLLRESLTLLWARANGARTMLQLHTPYMDRYMNKRWVRSLLHIAFLPVDQVTVLSPWWQRRLTEGGFPGTIVIPNPLSAQLEAMAHRTLARADSGPKVTDAEDPVVILAMARLTSGKGIQTAVEALAHLPERFVLDIAGDGPELRNLQDLARKIGVVDRTRFLGWISGTEKDRRLSEADIFCAPSKADAFSMSMIEALCHGLPVVTVRSRAIADLVKDGETGYVVEIDDSKAVAQAILALAQPSVRADMGRAAASWVLNELSGKVVGRRIEQAALAVLEDA